jgi:hypothetical protein
MRGPEAAGGPRTARTTLARDQEVCTDADIDAVRYEVARADVLADVAMQAFDLTIWREADAARIDHVAHLVSATSEAASAALLAVDDLRRAMVSRRGSRPTWNEEPGHE